MKGNEKNDIKKNASSTTVITAQANIMHDMSRKQLSHASTSGYSTDYEDDGTEHIGIADDGVGIADDIGIKQKQTTKTKTKTNTGDKGNKDGDKGALGWLVRTKFFRKKIDQAYDDMDVDGSGQIDFKEFYAGVLSIYLWLANNSAPGASEVR